MCRLYGLWASHPTKVACELLEAQNALIRQSRIDERGLDNPDGWGIGFVDADGEARRFRQAEPAFESEGFRAQALETRALVAIAHVRRATVGEPRLENTHPFRFDDEIMAHNGHVAAFERIRSRILEELDGSGGAVSGSTDSEHLGALLHRRRSRDPDRPPAHVLASVLGSVSGWGEAAGGGKRPLALNILWGAEGWLVGSRVGRSLWALEREGPLQCDVCGEAHASPPPGEGYRAAVIASERLTDEPWREIGDGSILSVGPEGSLSVEPWSPRDRVERHEGDPTSPG